MKEKQRKEKVKGKRSRALTKKEAKSLMEGRRNLLSQKSDFFVREAYKTLRTNVSFALEEKEGCKTIVVTSSLKDEGKSVTAINLAISYAMSDRKVLIIDCDLRRPKIARLLQLNSRAGLSSLIMDPELLENAILPTKVAGLDAVLSGEIPPNPSELLDSSGMKELLQRLQKRYDVIILDSPPVNIVTDAVVLAPYSDGVLFLVRAHHSERGAVIHAVEQLEYARAKILGFVLNDVNVEKIRYGTYRYKRYGRYSYDCNYSSWNQ